VTQVHWTFFDSEFLPSCIKLIPVLFSFFGVCFCFFFYYLLWFPNLIERDPEYVEKDFFIIFFFYKFLSHKWFFDFLVNFFIVRYFLSFCYFVSFKLIDRGFLEFFGNSSIVFFSKKFSLFFVKLHTGYIFHYIFFIIVSLSLFILFCFCFYFLFFFSYFLILWFFILIFLIYYS
jgi:hypothetical protein